MLPQAQKTLKKGSGGRGVILIALEHKEITRGMGQRKRVQIMPRGGKMNPTNDDKTLQNHTFEFLTIADNPLINSIYK